MHGNELLHFMGHGIHPTLTIYVNIEAIGTILTSLVMTRDSNLSPPRRSRSRVFEDMLVLFDE